MHWLDGINHFIETNKASYTVYFVLFFIAIIDGFFPPVPSEAILVTLATLSATPNGPWWWLLIPVGALGAIIGDNISYLIGKKVGTERFKWMRRPKVAKAFAWARHGLDERGAIIVLVARYIPVGRIAVNMTAGATEYPHRKFFFLTLVGGLSWACYSVGMGYFVGHQFKDNPLLGAGVAICVAVTLGVIIDHLSSRLKKIGVKN